MYIIGDVHGCKKTLEALLEKLNTKEPIAFVGDLIDRGPDSMGVVDFVSEKDYFCVIGNHEDFMLNSFLEVASNRKKGIKAPQSGSILSLWVHPQNGGGPTFDSYYEKPNKLLEHITWMQNLPLLIEFDDLVISHSSAGEYLNSGKKAEYEHDVIWGRHPNPPVIEGKFNVFGHTPRKNPLVEEHYACIDTGCVFGGKLTAMHWPSKEIVQQDFID